MTPDSYRSPHPWPLASPGSPGSIEELLVLYRLSLKALHDPTIVEMADMALDEVMTLIAPEHALLYDTDDRGLVLLGVRPPELARPQGKGVGECLCGLAVQRRQAIYSLDLHGEARCTEIESVAGEIRSFAALPLIVGDEMIGVIGLASTRERDFSGEGRLLEALATALALTIKKTRTCHELRERVLDLEGRVADCNAELMIRSNELERLNRIFVDREFRIKELRQRVKTLEGG